MTEPQASPSPASPQTAMPILYRKPVLLSNDQHANKSLAPKLDHRFAVGTNAVPLNGIELEWAQRHYPIVFSEEATPFPMAILGLRTAENLFVGESGLWQEGIYVPAYV